jgi:2',3'-cyclic-nucleotide 2'-phosphodiesterase (5'-nucleotidase family)
VALPLVLLAILLGAPVADRTVTLAFTGDSWGEVEPCGCPKVKLGGLAREAGVLQAWRHLGQPLLLLDSGDLLLRPGAGDAEREEAALRAALVYDLLAGMGLAAAVPGETDLILGTGFLRDLAAREGVTLLAANLVDRTGEMPFAGSTVLRVDGLSVGVLGVLSPSLCPVDLVAEPPVAAALSQIAQLKAMGPLDLLVVLAHEPPEEDAPLAKALPIDVLIAAHGGVPVPAAELEARTVRVRDGNSARFLGRLDLALGKPGTKGAFADGNALLRTWLEEGEWEKTPGPFAGSEGGRRYAAALIPLEEGLPNDAQVAKRLTEQRAETDARERARLASGLAAAAAPGQGVYAGVSRCASCHAKAHEVWAASSHAIAYETLVRAGHALDSGCVGCHTTGFQRPGGFQRPAQVGFLKEVQCEACHGPASAHAKNPKGERIVAVGEATCRGCHTAERSPSFNYSAYFPRIAHP